MADPHVYKIVEIVGSSPEGVDPAIRNGLARARSTLRNVEWFEVREVRGALVGETVYTQVRMGVGFRLEDDQDVG